jgi:DNA polymerase III delta prime subunit
MFGDEKMRKYNFHDLLEPMEFQNLVRDIVQVRDNIFLESYKDGKDQGIDGLLYDEHRKIVLQTKRYKLSFTKLFYTLKTEELPKVKKLKPTRYILGISMDFSPSEKEKIKELFEGFIINTNDIISSEDMNNLLGNPLYSYIEKNYTKLWLSSVEILSELLEKSAHKAQINESAYELKLAIKTAKFYVQTRMYKIALKKLERNNVIIISGEPGMGKTAMAYMLALSFLQTEAISGFLWVNSIEDVYAIIKNDDIKQVFILDDFWGSILYDRNKNNQERRLEKLIKLIANMRNKKLILTSREYILQQGLYKYLSLEKLINDFKLQCVLEEYSDSEKAKILFHHLKASNLQIDYIKEIYFNCDRIVHHQCYNPRIIDLYLSSNDIEQVSPYDYLENLIEYLEYPDNFWKSIFMNLSKEAKILAMIIMISYTPININDLKLSYSKYLLNYSGDLILKNFQDCVSELEQTIIKTYWDDNEEEIRVQFQNPSIQDFLYVYINDNLEQYVPQLLKSSSFYNQILYIFEHFNDDNSTEISNLIEKECISKFDVLPMKIADYGDLDGGEIYHMDEDNLLSNIFHLLRLCDTKKNYILFKFLQDYIYEYCENMGTSSFYANYFELYNFPGLIKLAVSKGMKFDGKIVINNYFRVIYNVHHYLAMDRFEEIFKEDYTDYKEKNQNYLKSNIKTIILESLDYFEDEEMCIQSDILVDSIPELLKKYRLRYTEKFKKYIFDIAGRVYEPKNEKLFRNTVNIEIEKTDDEIDYEQTVDEAYEWLFEYETYYLNDDEILSKIFESNLSDKIKTELEIIIYDRNPWYIYEFLLTESSLERFISIWIKERFDYIPHNVYMFFSYILHNIGKNDGNVIKKIIGFCAEYCNSIMHYEEAVISEKNFNDSEVYSLYVKGDEPFEKLLFQTVLKKSGNWIVINDRFIMLFCFVMIMSGCNENDFCNYFFIENFDKLQIKDMYPESYNTSYAYFQYGYYSFKNHNWERIIYRLFEEIDTYNFNQKHIHPLLNEFLNRLDTSNNDSRVVSLLERIKLTVDVLPSCEINSIQMVICDALSAAEYLDIGDIADMWVTKFTKEQMKLLRNQKSICKKNNGKYVIEIYKEKDISILTKLGLYDILLNFLNLIEKICLRFSEGDYSNILYT